MIDLASLYNAINALSSPIFFARLFYFVSLSYKNDINADTRFSHIVEISCVIHVRQMRLILYPKGE